MKFSLRKLAVVVALGGLSVGLVGAGVGANFTAGGLVTQHVDVGTMGTLTITGGGTAVSGTDGTVTLTCPAITVLTSTGSANVCGTDGFKITYKGGTAAVSNLILAPSMSNNSIPQDQLAKFNITWSDTGGFGALDAYNTLAKLQNPTPNPVSISIPSELSTDALSAGLTINPTITWGGTDATSLGNSALGTSGDLQVTVTIQA